MKRKETVDDEGVKTTSATQRALGKVEAQEMEDPEEFKLQKEIKSATNKNGQRQKKEAREDREKTEQVKKLIANRKKDKSP